MKRSWLKIGAVAALAFGIIAHKRHTSSTTKPISDFTPQVLLVADFAEANAIGDRCADIIGAVREAAQHGVKVQEFNSDSRSALIEKLRVVSIPTVIIFDKQGREAERFVGEEAATAKALRLKLATLSGG